MSTQGILQGITRGIRGGSPMKAAFLTSAFLAVGLSAAWAEDVRTFRTEKVSLKVEQLAAGLSHPWAVEVMPDGRYIVTERNGRLRIIDGGKVSDPVGNVPKVFAQGQGGLLDVALDPDFRDNRRIFLTAAVAMDGGSGTAVYSATLAKDDRSLSDVREIFAMNRFTPGRIQYGSRIAFARDSSLFVSIGDRGDRDRSQDWQDDAGSILHINADGSIPAPPGGKAKGLPEIWSKGHRNPQGITIDTADGKLYTVEHGARGGDEINMPERGRNYGWPIITYGRDYSGAKIGEGTAKKGLEQPLHYWDPSIAPGALAVYRGRMFPEWNGDFIVAALKFKLLSRMHRDASGKFVSEERMLTNEYGRIRDVVVAPDGALLLVTDEDDGRLLRVSRASGQEG